MIVIWTIIVIVTAHAPVPGVFRQMCAQDGGTLLVKGELVRDAKGKVHKAALLRCVRPNEPGPPKVLTYGSTKIPSSKSSPSKSGNSSGGKLFWGVISTLNATRLSVQTTLFPPMAAL